MEIETENNKPATERMTSRRFWLALIFTVGGTGALYLDKMTPEHYGFLALAVLGGYAATRTKWSK